MNAAKSAATIVLPTGVPATMETKRPASEQTTLKMAEQIVTDKKLLKKRIALRAGKIIKALIKRLATCEYITDHRNLIITGATGCGKTYMACAFGMEACKQYYNTKYIRIPELLMELEESRSNGNFRKTLAKYANPVVLILDEWLLMKPNESEQKDILELIHHRRKKSSTIFCSQYGFDEWYEQLGGNDSPISDAIIDRIAHDSYMINITSIDAEHDISMREVYGLDKKLRE